jgi:hypothetical protein
MVATCTKDSRANRKAMRKVNDTLGHLTEKIANVYFTLLTSGKKVTKSWQNSHGLINVWTHLNIVPHQIMLLPVENPMPQLQVETCHQPRSIMHHLLDPNFEMIAYHTFHNPRRHRSPSRQNIPSW